MSRCGFLCLQVYLHLVPDERQLPGPGPAVRHPPECDSAHRRRPGVGQCVTELMTSSADVIAAPSPNQGAKGLFTPEFNREKKYPRKLCTIFIINFWPTWEGLISCSLVLCFKNNSRELIINPFHHGDVGLFEMIRFFTASHRVCSSLKTNQC